MSNGVLPDWPGKLQFTPDGRRLLVAFNSGLKAYDTSTYTVLASKALVEDGGATNFSISADGSMVAATERRYPQFWVRFLRADTLQLVNSWTMQPDSIQYSPDGAFLWYEDGKGLHAARISDGTLVFSTTNHEARVGRFAISRDNSKIAFSRGDGSVGLFPNPLH